jgi:hypothetical protein
LHRRYILMPVPRIFLIPISSGRKKVYKAG